MSEVTGVKAARSLRKRIRGGYFGEGTVVAAEWCLFKDIRGLCLSAEAWAAWAQALGAVIAIASGFAVAAVQAHLARKDAVIAAAERRLQATLTLVIVCESTCRRVDAFRENMNSPTAFFVTKLRLASEAVLEEMRGLARSSEALPLFDVSHETARLALAFRTHVLNFISDASYALGHASDMDEAAFRGYFESADFRGTYLRRVLEEMERLAERLHIAAGRPEIYVGEDSRP